MKHFIAIVHHDSDSAFGMSFPDLPGCFSAADESGDILSNAIEAIALWGEDRTLPEPSSIETVRIAAKDDLRDGAFLLAVPVKAPEAA